MVRLHAFWHKLKHGNDGFLLEEMLFATIISCMLASAVFAGLSKFNMGSRQMDSYIQLNEAGRYMMAGIERDIGYWATDIDLSDDRKITCKTIFGKYSVIYSFERNCVYRTSITVNGRGKNPHFMPDCSVESWDVYRVSPHSVLVSFVLSKGKSRQRFQKLIYCLNGTVSGGRAVSGGVG